MKLSNWQSGTIAPKVMGHYPIVRNGTKGYAFFSATNEWFEAERYSYTWYTWLNKQITDLTSFEWRERIEE